LRLLPERVRLIVGVVLLVLATSFLLSSGYSWSFAEDYKEGEVVRRTVVAPADINTIDLTETERRRNAARESTRPIFNYDSTRAANSAQSFRAAWDDLKRQIDDNEGKPAVWSGDGGPAVARAIFAHHFDLTQLDRLTTLLREAGEGYIYDDTDAERLKQEIVLVDVRNPSAQMIIPSAQTRMAPLSAARRNLELRILRLPGWGQEERAALIAAMVPLLRPNVVLDESATASARETEANNIAQIPISLKRNQVIAREGDTVTPSVLARLAALKSTGRSGRPWHYMAGLLLVVAAVYWAAWKFTEHRSSTAVLALSKRTAFALVGSAILVETVFMRVGFTVADSVALQMSRAPFNDPTIWSFAIPFAAAALLVAMLVDTQLAFLTGIVSALFAGILAPPGVPTIAFAMISGCAAVYGIGRYRERQSVTLAGLITGAANAVMALALIAYAEQAFTVNTILLAIGCGIAGGLLTAIFAAGGLPINESFFGILTDVKLLELSNADLPVLGQLALRAPGTNQHSHAVGQLAEDACRVVGANPLLARIGALYHDIGKLAAPEYFVENQQGDNPHDKLRPTQSAKIITSHVSYGQRLAK
jgi:putative nucleotidyltransferase with HDIG domain